MQIFDWLLKGNFFNFLILLFLIGFLVVKLDFASMIANSVQSIAKKISDSDSEKDKSQEFLNSAINEEQNLPLQLEKIREEAQNTIETFKKSSIKELDEVEKRLLSNAQKIVKSEKEKLSRELQKELAINVVDRAYDKTLQALRKDNKLHRKFISEAIENLERLSIK